MRVLKAAATYFVLVFGAGFVLGAIRVTWIVPRIGARAAVLLETPLVLAVSVLAALWRNRRLAAGASRGKLGGQAPIPIFSGREPVNVPDPSVSLNLGAR
jgi:predicted MFS family arabinose efflux permease